MKADVVGPSVGESSGQSVHGLNHQVDIHRYRGAIGLYCMRLEGPADHRAEGQVGHVMVVHHIEMDPVGAGSDDIFHLVAQAGEVG